ncbi:MAG: CapA family protein [Candidatus Faecousia sp.]|nr:CapA family protein [Candidatus Faecousia sp.]
MKLLLFGDICPTPDYLSLFDDRSGKALFGAVEPLIVGADQVLCNLECPATDTDCPIQKCGPSLRAAPKHIEMLKNSGFTALAAANNHILDYGEAGLRDTLRACAEQSLPIFGAGNTLEDAGKPMVFTQPDGAAVTVFAFGEEEFNLAGRRSGGAVGFDPYTAYDRIREAKEHGRVIVLYHGGIEYYRLPSPLLKKKCEKMVDCGADLVLCQHSHIIGTVEKRGQGTIVYGQGNSVFGYRQGSDTWNEGLLVQYDTVKNEICFFLLKADKSGIRLAQEEERDRRMEQIMELSAQISDEAFLASQWDKFCQKDAALYYGLFYGRGRVVNKLNRILGGRLLNLLYSKKKKMISMNLIRCDAHREVMKTILERDFYGRN